MGCHSFGDAEKQNGLVLENKLSASTIDMGEVHYKNGVQMEIFLSKSNQFHELMATDAKDFETGVQRRGNLLWVILLLLE
ncbi:unnamed protein product [Sphagnum jensenii]|uniref:Uncharacterized protein n=1 Tax=Sphagnum jensenii TaxID=128206 RepID=A0ABP0W686_9BRYO